MGSSMTTPDNAQPEALRLAANLRRMNMLTINCMELERAANELEKAHTEIDRLRALAATCYAGLGGECDLPVIWLDALNDAANGEPFDLDGLLPYTSTMRAQLVTQTNRAAAAEQQVTALTQRLDTANALNTEARNQLAQAQAVPEGWKLVPVEPTLEMLAQASMRLQENEFPAETELEFQEDAHTAWDGMLAASPTPPARKPYELDLIRQAICDYHYALDTRQHGGEAQSKAFDAITDALGMYWRPGQEAALRKKGATHD